MEDSSGNGNDLIINGNPVWSVIVPPTIVTDSFSLLFDDFTYGQLIDSLKNSNFDFTSGFTIEAWIKPTQINDSAILSKFPGFMMWFKNNIVINYIDGSQTVATSNLVDNSWHHVAITWDGINQAVYVDGVREGDLVAHSSPPSSTGASLLLGSYNPSSFNFIGNIDEVKVYNYARSQSEILSDAGIAGSVVINEIMWSGSNAVSSDEWIELKNNTSSTIDLTNWSIENLGNSSTPISIPSGIIIPNGYFLIANNLANNSIINVDPDFQTPSIELINTGEQLILKDNKGLTIDTANDSGPWFAGDNAVPNKSMSRNSPSGDGTLSANWHTSTTSQNLDIGATELATPQTAND